MASTSETFEVTAECLCKANTFTTKVPTSELPIPAYACHCTSCRHSTGALYSIDSRWPEPRDKVDTTKLKSYAFSEKITILFCGTCSTPLFFESASGLGIFTGALKNHDADLVKISDHIFVGDTVDGGATMWLRKPNPDGKEVPRYEKRDGAEPYPYDWPANSTLAGYEAKRESETIPFWCHCKGVDFLIHRGNYESKAADELPWFIDPKTKKPLASFDACDSCRLQSGIDIFHWTFVELANIYLAASNGGTRPTVKNTQELKAAVDAGDASIGTLGYYKSSPDVQRYFCKVCSATVFYAADDRPEIVDAAVGLLDAADGARAESFVSWAFGGRSSWVDDTKGGWREGLLKRVEVEADEWRINRDYPKNWRRVEKEAKEGKA